MCSEIYEALKLSGEKFFWTAKSDQKKGFRFDRAMEFHGKHFFFECETGSKYSRRMKEYLKIPGRFFVVFTVQDYGEITAADYGKWLIDFLWDYRRKRNGKPDSHLGSQFLVTDHQAFCENVLADYLMQPAGGGKVLRHSLHSLS
jgi:hypothetical protein